MTQPEPSKTRRREQWAWYLYDFGNSAYAAVVLLAVYSVYFKEGVVAGPEGSALWGLALTIAMLVVAVIAPFLGTLADYSRRKKVFLVAATGRVCDVYSTVVHRAKGRYCVGDGFIRPGRDRLPGRAGVL